MGFDYFENLISEEIKGQGINGPTDLDTARYFHILALIGKEKDDTTRNRWKETQLARIKQSLIEQSNKGARTLYNEVFNKPEIEITRLPHYSFCLQFQFQLSKPYLSKDDRSFFIIDNPVRKDRVLGLPYVAASSWKGSIRATLRRDKPHDSDESVDYQNRLLTLFGNDKEVTDEQDARSGYLMFYPTFFDFKSLEIINPQLRKERVGSVPIYIESVPAGTEGWFTLLYVPFNLARTGSEMTRDLSMVIKGLENMLCTYGFGAKTASDFGLASPGVNGTLDINIRVNNRPLPNPPVPPPNLPRQNKPVPNNARPKTINALAQLGNLLGITPESEILPAYFKREYNSFDQLSGYMAEVQRSIEEEPRQ